MRIAIRGRIPLERLGVATLVAIAGCRSAGEDVPSQGAATRRINPADVALADGYAIEVVASGLTYPTGVTFDADGRPCVVEGGYCYGETWAIPRLLRIGPGGSTETIAEGDSQAGPWNGVAFHDGAFFVAEGGTLHGGRILQIAGDGSISVLCADLPSQGDHQANGPAIGPDGKVYFGVGSATNSGVVGEDNAMFGWLKREPAVHDIPGADVTLNGVNFETEDPIGDRDSVTTGAFLPFGTPSEKGQVIRGRVACNGAILRVPRGGGALERVAWGFRNPFALAFDPRGRLHVVDNGYDERGSRPVFGSGEPLHAVVEGTWYGWPDYDCGVPLTDDYYDQPGKPELELLIADPPNVPPKPLVVLPVHSSCDGLDFSRSAAFGHVGEAFVAEFGDQSPAVGEVSAPVGFKIARVDLASALTFDFAVNRGEVNGPASKIGSGGLERPVALRFDPSGGSLYVVDFGIVTETPDGTTKSVPGTGVLWRIRSTSTVGGGS